MPESKVRFGVKNLHIGKYNVASDGTVTLGTPMHIPGTVKISMDPDAEMTEFWADDVLYYVCNNDSGVSGEIENANFKDTFKTEFLNYITLDDGGVAQIKGRNTDPVYMMFESDGDQEKRRGILYNVVLGSIKREYATVEKTKTPQTATLPFNCYGDNETGIIRVSYGASASGYETLFTNPPVPTLPDES